MSNTLFAVLGSLAPVRSLLRRFSLVLSPTAASAPRDSARLSGSAEAAVTALTESARPALIDSTCVRPAGRASRPLRVVRVMEAGQAAAHGGRMVISGRMADVCAELERMAERESMLGAGA